LSSRGLVAIGKRSYGFYLWHWPVQFILLRVDAVTEHRLLHWSASPRRRNSPVETS